MEVKTQSKMTFHGVDIVNVNFNSSKIFALNENIQIDIETNPSVFYPKDSPLEFKIIMNITLKVLDYFSLEILGVGNFEFEGEMNDELKKNLVNTNAPAIMFPYIRSFITTFTANLGNPTGTLTIPVHFFNGDLEEIEEN